MKSFLICLLAAAALTVGLEGALGNPAEPAASGGTAAYQDCEKLESQPQAYAACEDLEQKLSPAANPGAKPSSASSPAGDGY